MVEAAGVESVELELESALVLELADLTEAELEWALVLELVLESVDLTELELEWVLALESFLVLVLYGISKCRQC